jgi:hypothetical protein
MEVRYLEAKDSLTYNAFRAMQIVKNGVYGESNNYIGGVVTLKTMGTDNSFTSHYGNITDINITSQKLKINSYIFNGLNISDFNLTEVTDGLYLIEFNATKESILNSSDLNQTDIVTYQRLVYTR